MMKRNCLIFFFILTLAVFNYSQSIENISEWQKFSPAGEEFTVEVPVKMLETVAILRNAKKENVFAYGNYRTYFKGTYYFIFSEIIGADSGAKFPVLNEIVRQLLQASSSQTVNFSFLKGERFDVKDQEDFFHTVLLVKTKERFYTFHLVQEEKDEETINHFLKSVKFHGISGQPREQSPEEIKKNIETARNNNNLNDSADVRPPNVVTSNNGQNASISQTDNSKVRSLQIKTKPQTSYTNSARNYQVTGMVQLRVTFLENGEIGAINPVKKLPFGLTAAAINAARQITFVPAAIEGKPVTVTKQVQYVFTLY